MKLTAISARDFKPLKLVEINNLSDVVVIAGPNGVGKTRLIAKLLQHIHFLSSTRGLLDQNFHITVKATNDTEKASWGKDTITTNNLQDMELFRYTLEAPNRRRSNITSSFLNFESNRTTQQVKPYPWDWNLADPFQEETMWNIGLSSVIIRFEDMIHSIFRKMRSHREAIALHYDEELRKRVSETAALEVVQIDSARFPDPFQSFKNAFSQLLAPKELLDPDMRNQKLSFRTDDGQSLPISDLSSGEKEVVNIVFDFLLRGPSDCIVIFDEPELHLHPELSYRLLQTLRQTGSRNQFIFCTHSADIITASLASLDDTVVFIAPPRDGTFNQALIVKEDDETHQALKLLGQSIGVISLGRKIVLIEGEHGSLDKQTYGAILKNRFPKLVLVPSGGKDLIKSFGTLHELVLAKTIWGIEFFMLCDRDALPSTDSRAVEAVPHLRLLRRYHLENYFLDEFTIAKVFEPMAPDDCWLRAPERIRSKLKDIAREQTSYAAALMTAAYFREKCGNVAIMPKGCNGKSVDELVTMILNRSTEEKTRITNFLDNSQITEHISTIMQAIELSLLEDSDVWKELIPGRIILKKFCREAQLGYDFFRPLYITAAELVPSNPFEELISIFRYFDQFALPHAGAA